MNESETDRNAKNQSIVSSLRDTFAPLTERLTSDVEPATVYTPITSPPEDEE